MAFKSNRLIYAYSPLLAILGAFAVYQGLQLRQLTETVESRSLERNVATLEQQQETLRSEWDIFKNTDFVTADQHQADQLELSSQLMALQQTPQADTWLELRQDLSVLSTEVEAIQQALQALKSPAQGQPSPGQPTPPPPSPSKPRATTPPFKVFGIERRGGETFLAVSPSHNSQLSNVQLMRVGDSRDGWYLTALKSDKAQFTQPNGRRQTVAFR